MSDTLTEIEVRPPFIKLEQFLKLSAAVETGGMAKQVINEGLVKVDGEVCTMRGKKLKGGEKVEFEGQGFVCIVKKDSV